LKNCKIIYTLLDGIGDLPNPELNELTPLEAAYTPSLDTIARNGVAGQVISVGIGIAPQSDIAVFNMLGYNFKEKDYVGRGVVECLGCGIDFRNGDLALRGNFATIDSDNKIVDRRAGRIISKEEADEICKLITENIKIDDVQIAIKNTVGHRVIIRFRHEKIKLMENITNTDPAYDKIDGIGIAKTTNENELFVLQSQSMDEESLISSEIVNTFSKKVIDLLKDCKINEIRVKNGLLPINCILLRDAGNRYPTLQPIQEKYGLNVASLVDMPVEIGISKILKMTPYDAGNTDDYELKAQTLLKVIGKHDLIYVHIKGPDEFGHDGNAKGKKKNIEEIDSHFFKPLLDGLRKLSDYDINFIICGDHSTPCIKKAHSDDPIPLLISGDHLVKDGSSRYTESDSQKGRIGQIYGYTVIDEALRYMHKK
jgi:2,3-bisphosphoglycerate-independent phosphoglycerate mutase